MGTYQIFIYLQLLDLLTTLLGFRLGAAEASPFVRLMMHAGAFNGAIAPLKAPACIISRTNGLASAAPSRKPRSVVSRSNSCRYMKIWYVPIQYLPG